MRRLQTIVLVLAILASPLSLLARAMDSATSCCDKICCLPHHSHSAALPHGFTAPAKSAQCGMNCWLDCEKQSADYGLSVLMHPGIPLGEAFVAIPPALRVGLLARTAFASPGFVSPPHQPPRA